MDMERQAAPALPSIKSSRTLSKIETVGLVDATQAFDAFYPNMPYNVRVSQGAVQVCFITSA
jgi:hypothetical protein